MDRLNKFWQSLKLLGKKKKKPVSYWSPFHIPPRPRHIPLTPELEKYLAETNTAFLQFARELYANPADAPAMGERYSDLIGIHTRLHVQDLLLEPWIPGALLALPRTLLTNKNEYILTNPQALEQHKESLLYDIPLVVLKPRLDLYVVDHVEGSTTYVRWEPLQNLHAAILPDPGEELFPGVKEIIFDEDYQINMIDPDTVIQLIE